MSPNISGPNKADEERWRAEDDMRTLAKAEEIRLDKPRHRRAIAMAKEQVANLQKITRK